jgi:hypothetical protein
MLTSYFSAVYVFFNFTEVVQSGYNKHRGGMFKIPLLDYWMVVLSGGSILNWNCRCSPDILICDTISIRAPIDL